MHPLKRLWRRVPRYRGRIVRGTALSVANVIFDVAPELLIGVAIDVVVRDDDSFVAQSSASTDRSSQLLILAAVNAVVWILESLTEYLAVVTWRNLAQAIQHDLRTDAYAHVQDLELAWFEDRAPAAADDPQRRRQPARALPRRRRVPVIADRADRGRWSASCSSPSPRC